MMKQHHKDEMKRLEYEVMEADKTYKKYNDNTSKIVFESAKRSLDKYKEVVKNEIKSLENFWKEKISMLEADVTRAEKDHKEYNNDLSYNLLQIAKRNLEQSFKEKKFQFEEVRF